jgi:hypothetical protein
MIPPRAFWSRRCAAIYRKSSRSWWVPFDFAQDRLPRPEAGCVIEGELTLLVDGKPPQTLKPGDSCLVPPVAVPDARAGDKGAKVMAVYVGEKGKPLASPAP